MRVVWKNKKGKVVGCDLVEQELFAIKEQVRSMFEGKQVKGVFLLDGLNKWQNDFAYGIKADSFMFGANKIVLATPLRYNYIYSFDTHKLYKTMETMGE